MQNLSRTRNRELNILTQTATELNFEITVKFVGLSRHLMFTVTQIKQRPLLSPCLVINIQITSTDEPPFDQLWDLEQLTTPSLV